MNIQEYLTSLWDNRNESPYMLYDILILSILVFVATIVIIRQLKESKAAEKLLEQQKKDEKRKTEIETINKRKKQEEEKRRKIKNEAESKEKAEKILKEESFKQIKEKYSKNNYENLIIKEYEKLVIEKGIAGLIEIIEYNHKLNNINATVSFKENELIINQHNLEGAEHLEQMQYTIENKYLFPLEKEKIREIEAALLKIENAIIDNFKNQEKKFHKLYELAGVKEYSIQWDGTYVYTLDCVKFYKENKIDFSLINPIENNENVYYANYLRHNKGKSFLHVISVYLYKGFIYFEFTEVEEKLVIEQSDITEVKKDLSKIKEKIEDCIRNDENEYPDIISKYKKIKNRISATFNGKNDTVSSIITIYQKKDYNYYINIDFEYFDFNFDNSIDSTFKTIRAVSSAKLELCKLNLDTHEDKKPTEPIPISPPNISTPGEREKGIRKKIGYLPNVNFLQAELYKYCVVKMPKENSWITFPRNGRLGGIGAIENKFSIELKNYFGNDFKIFTDKHLPFSNNNVYEPDFVFENEKNNKNIFIDIEIDEPYDFGMRKPTHCIGDDDRRDAFFNSKGWIVIRFAEIQIAKESRKCCALIAKVIASIDKTFQSELLLEDNPTPIEQWDNLQSQKWQAINYRGSYLNIEEPNISLNNLDTFPNWIVQNPQPIINDTNPSETKKIEKNRDTRITFDETNHVYSIDGNSDTISVTQLIDKFFPVFDSLIAVTNMMNGMNWNPNHKYWGWTKEAIIKEWEDKNKIKRDKGTQLHRMIENYYNGLSIPVNTKEVAFFRDFINHHPNLEKYQKEWRIFDEDLLIAGTVDIVYKNSDNGQYEIYDWKRSENVVNIDGSKQLSSPTGRFTEFGLGELKHLTNDSYYKYALQLNIYKTILERRYGIQIGKMNLLVLHENYDRYYHLPIPEMKNEIDYIFKFSGLRK